MKKLISLFMAVVMLFGIGAEAFAAYESDKVHTYESANCTIVYSITNEWSGNQQISVSITNNSEETLRNWAIKFDNTGNISNIWNASVLKNDGEMCVIRNNGYNYELIPNATVEFGFMQQGDTLSLPENISLCSKMEDSTASTEISYEIQNNWGEGFIAAVTIKNISNEPLEAWKLHFNGNFDISSIWNANLLYTEDDSFKVENDITTTPIAIGETKTFSFEGKIALGKEPVMSDFMLTSIVIDMEAGSENSDSDETGETNETGDPSESGDTEETEEPDTPDQPVEPEEAMILCFGEYNEEKNALGIFWYSTNEGKVSVFERSNENPWTKIADIDEGNSYTYELSKDFLAKQIKVKQETESGTLESVPFVVVCTENGYACTWLDSDEDGLPDYLEELYGTDSNNADTDGDRLTDYEEILSLGTNPLKYDTDENGINDADDDIDGDALSNKAELKLGTNPADADTDGDGLSDLDEIDKYNTDPLKADSDGDTLSDGDEIAIGLDPNNPETFGVPDAEYKVEQTISADNELFKSINAEDSPYEISVELTASGNATAQLSANESPFSAITKNSARLGGAVTLSYIEGEVDRVKISYKIDDKYISNEGSEYAENCFDLSGIKRYNIFKYFEDLNMLLPIATEFDEKNDTLFAVTDELGTYCVLDMEILMRNLGIEPEESISVEIVEKLMYSAAVNSEEENIEDVTDGEYNIIFIIDDRSTVISEEQFDNIKEQILEFAETIVVEKRDLKITIYNQSASDFREKCCELSGTFEPKEHDYESTGGLSGFIGKLSFSNSDTVDLMGENCIISDGLTEAISNCTDDTRNYIFDIYAQDDAVYDTQFCDSILNVASENKVNISIISDTDALTGFQGMLTDSTNGIVLDYNDNFASKIYKHIFEEKYVPKDIPQYDYVAEFDAILATGLQKVCLNSELYPNGTNPSREDTDTDMDGLTDWDEVNFEYWEEQGLITYDEKHNVVLPTIGQCVKFTKKSYVFEGLKRLEESSNYATKLLNTRVMPISSDPTNSDSDNDDLLDIEEYKLRTSPLNCDTDFDGLWDGDELYIGTNPRKSDTDDDGLSDYFEVDLWYNPRDPDPDEDGFNDKEEYTNGTNPFVYNLTLSEEAEELNRGFWLGDWETADNLSQLAGQVLSCFVPFLADARDYFANLFKNLDTWAAILNVAGFCTDLLTYGSEYGTDVAKTAPKLTRFITKYADDTPKVIDAISQTSKAISQNDEALSILVKALPDSSLNKIADSIKNAQNITKADYLESLDILKAAGKNIDSLRIPLSELNVIDSKRVLDLVSQYGDDAVKIFDTYGNEIFRVIDKVGTGKLHLVFSFISKVDADDVPKLLGLIERYGDDVIKAITKCDEKRYKAFVYLISNSNLKRVPEVLDLIAKYGDTIIDVVKRCGIENAGIIVDGIKLCGGNADIINKLLKILLEHSNTMIKALPKCRNINTIKDYIKIFDRFGAQADKLFLNGERVFGEFFGLDRALESNAEAICFASTKAGDKCFVTVSGVYTYNRTITVSEDVATELRRIDALDDISDIEKGKLFTKVYNDLLTDKYLKTITDPKIKCEYEKLVKAVSDARSTIANNPNARSVTHYTGIDNEYSLFENRSIINCAEIWSAREVILQGGKFEDIMFSTRSYLNSSQAVGSLKPPCANCQNVFAKILSNLEGS